jgi:hypothetical protein
MDSTESLGIGRPHCRCPWGALGSAVTTDDAMVRKSVSKTTPMRHDLVASAVHCVVCRASCASSMEPDCWHLQSHSVRIAAGQPGGLISWLSGTWARSASVMSCSWRLILHSRPTSRRRAVVWVSSLWLRRQPLCGVLEDLGGPGPVRLCTVGGRIVWLSGGAFSSPS